MHHVYLVFVVEVNLSCQELLDFVNITIATCLYEALHVKYYCKVISSYSQRLVFTVYCMTTRTDCDGFSYNFFSIRFTANNDLLAQHKGQERMITKTSCKGSCHTAYS